MQIIGRKAEKRELQRYVDSCKPEFIAVYGRRRVGKTYLIREFFEEGFCFHLTGMANADREAQIEGFNAATRRYFGGDMPTASTWFEAFEQLTYLLERVPHPGKKTVFIDEMPWLDTPKSGFLSALEHFWNSWASARPEILLIACGSASSWMTNKLINNTGGLYNRVTGIMSLEPFTLAECEEYLAFLGITYGRSHIIESYMAFGGVPYYMSLMIPSLSLYQNIDHLCFKRTAKLKTEFTQLYATLFKQDHRHREVVETLAEKAVGLTRKEIIQTCHFENGGSVTRILGELEDCGFIRKYHPFGKRARDAVYQLVDPFSLFHLRFLKDHREDDEAYWSNYAQSGSYNAWAGYAFEQVCLAHLRQVKAALGISGVLTRSSAWRSAGHSPGAQIDLVIDRNDGIINLCEMKYSNREFVITADYEKNLRNKRGLFEGETRTKKGIHLTLISTYGIQQNKHAGIIQSQITTDDLFTA